METRLLIYASNLKPFPGNPTVENNNESELSFARNLREGKISLGARGPQDTEEDPEFCTSIQEN